MAEQIQNLKTQLADTKQTQDSLIKALDSSKQNTNLKKEDEMLATIKNLSSALTNVELRCENFSHKYSAIKKSFSKHLNNSIKDKENPNNGSDIKDYNIKITCSEAYDSECVDENMSNLTTNPSRKISFNDEVVLKSANPKGGKFFNAFNEEMVMSSLLKNSDNKSKNLHRRILKKVENLNSQLNQM